MQSVTITKTDSTRVEKYRQMREAIGTQAEVAKMLGIARSALHRREAGKRKITDEVFFGMCFLQQREADEIPAPKHVTKPEPLKPPQPDWDENPTPAEIVNYGKFLADILTIHDMFSVWKDSKLIAAVDPEREIWRVQGNANIALLARRYGTQVREAFARHFNGATFEIEEL